ncbi:helix-turn-helix domain-containing protein [uncultured Lactobacillus sp.]|uniref:helix-turn-helix domain-containing protein n=1 Tax=uncultured Lactobacillus sp. TaxID=153152 RepID=UPI0025D2F5EF|nr:helix-turn-helix transcriptional regulator [uncultured Lactobacillus sp.]
MSTFERIKELTKKKHLTLAKVNDMAGIGTNSIYSWKTSVPSIENLQKVAKVLHTSTDYLLGNTDDPAPASNDKESGTVDLDHDQVFSYRGRHVPEKYLKMVKELMDADIDEDNDDNGEWLN